MEGENTPLLELLRKGRMGGRKKELGGIPGKGSHTKGNKADVIVLFAGHSKEGNGQNCSCWSISFYPRPTERLRRFCTKYFQLSPVTGWLFDLPSSLKPF